MNKGKKKGRAEASWEEINARGPEPSIIAHDKRPGNTTNGLQKGPRLRKDVSKESSPVRSEP